MEIFNLIYHVHWIPAIVMTIFSFLLGALWHSPVLFGKIWTKEINPTGAKQQINAPLIFGGTGILHFIAIMSLSAIVSSRGFMYGLLTGLLISIVWVVPVLGGTYLFANRSLKLLAIDAGMYIVLFSVSGLVLGVW